MKVDDVSQAYQSSIMSHSSVTLAESGGAQSSSQLSIEQIRQKYDVNNISLKEIDGLVKDLKQSDLVDGGDWLMLATHGHLFRSHLPGYAGGDKKVNLSETLSNQLTMAKQQGAPTESIEKQIAIVDTLKSDSSLNKHSDKTTSEQSSERNEEWLTETMRKLLDYRMGIDREKLNEIDEKIKAIENDNSISKADKASLIAALEEQKDTLIQKAAEEAVEKEKQLAGNRPLEAQNNQALLDVLNNTNLYK